MSENITTSGTAQLRIYNHYIDGCELRPENGRYLDRVSPSNGDVDAMIAIGCRTDISRAVKAARAASRDIWKDLPGSRRAQLLNNVANQLAEWNTLVARTESLDVGKPICDSRADVVDAIATWKHYASMATQPIGAIYEHDETDFLRTVREPLGVIGIILPWSSPILHFSRYVAAALACGNTVVVKPSEHAPRPVLKLAETCKAAGIPNGVINVVLGNGPGTGGALVGHRDIDHICFMGSSEIGKLVAAMAAGQLTGVTCELSAKNMAIVYADCDLDEAAKAVCAMAFRCQGQSNASASNVIVENSVRKSFVKRLAKQMKSVQIGPPLDDATAFSCLASGEQLERIECFVKIGQEEGAKLVCGGKRPVSKKLGNGFYYEPTIFDDVKPEMTIAQEEIFGPILSVIQFSDDADVVPIVNGTRYGMATAIFTNDEKRIRRLISELEIGNVFVNRPIRISPGGTWAGMRESGLGAALGDLTLNTFTRTRTIDAQSG